MSATATHPVMVAGVCRVCGCTDLDACICDDGFPCAWVDAEHTLCSACLWPEEPLEALITRLSTRGCGIRRTIVPDIQRDMQ